jgi:hypothetical protein
MKKSLAKSLARSNGGDLEKARETLEQRTESIERNGYEYTFRRNLKYKKYEEVNFNE